MAYRSAAPDLVRERDRFQYERDRGRFGDIRERVEEEDDRVYVRRFPSRPPPREGSVDRRSRPPFEDDETVIREHRRVIYDDDPPRRSSPRRRSPPESEVSRARSRVTIKERIRSPSPDPMPRPGRLMRRQSSLDTFDHIRDREDYPPPPRRLDHSMPPYVDRPLPRSRGLPPPRVYAERDYYDEIAVSERHRHEDDHFHRFPERVREKEIIRERRRSVSRSSRRSRRRARSRSRSSSRSSSSSSSGGTALTSKSEYPKKGKTRIPARLVSKRALIDLGYPFVEEGKTIIVQKALGQKNIDDLLKLSDDYKKSEFEIIAARSSAGDVVEERRTEIVEYRETTQPVIMPHRPAPTMISTGGGKGPVIINAQPAPQTPVEVVNTTTIVRDHSPTRSSYSYDTTSYGTTSYGTSTTYDTMSTVTGGHYGHRGHHGAVIVEARPREVMTTSGPLALVEERRVVERRGSRDSDDLRSEIRTLERQLARKERHERSRSRGDLVRAHRLSTGELVLFEEEIETIEEPSRGGVRIERDKRGRMSISVPRNR
ncbi:hypothetical protein QBC38DRAFT_511925 [Podospora fimiseda]|uniref:DUF8035 domain-containing protein n=1 Tax=Podospora fimiseda TaxID=252190 RepID=A0AAN7BJ08_9PEZI|nr:hypothetical protein QBC38DRAFT_511925 [Podospora fimiseda]